MTTVVALCSLIALSAILKGELRRQVLRDLLLTVLSNIDRLSMIFRAIQFGTRRRLTNIIVASMD